MRSSLLAPATPDKRAGAVARSRIVGLDTATLRFVFTVGVLSRVWNALFVLYGASSVPVNAAVEGGPGVGPHWLRPYTYFDGQSYLRIASGGYRSLTSVFYPIYPMLLRLVGRDPATEAVFGAALSSVAFVAALLVLYKLVARERNDAVARATVVVIAFLPFSAIWGSIYTESVALLLLTLTWWFVRTGRWGLAVVPAALAGATRNIGLVLGLALIAELIQQTKSVSLPGERVGVIRRAFVCVVPIASTVAVMVWAYWRFGGRGGLAAQQLGYDRAKAWPWWAVAKDLSTLTSYITLGKFFALASIVIALILTATQWREVRLGYHVMVWGVLAMHFVMARQHPPYTIGAARYLMTAFPFSFALAAGYRRIPRRWTPILVSVLLIFCAAGAYTIGAGQFELG